jgi:hypothetical protein
MNPLPFARVLAIATILGLAVAQPATSWSAEGTGAHALDWFVGTWTCKNSLPSVMGGPAAQTVTVARSVTGSGFSVRIGGTGFERSGYFAYVPSTKTWWNPFSYPNGNYASESALETGTKTVWTGPYFDATTGQTMQVRDTYTTTGATGYTDVGEYQSGGTWHTGVNGTCTKST